MIIGVTGAIDEAISPLISSKANEMTREKMLLAHSVKEHGLWPATVRLRELSIEQTLRSLETFPGAAHIPEADEACPCREPTLDLAGKFREIRQTLLNEQRSGLCLDCVVSRGETAEKGACRLGDCG
jgi:hypothetical protein